MMVEAARASRGPTGAGVACVVVVASYTGRGRRLCREWVVQRRGCASGPGPGSAEMRTFHPDGSSGT